MFFNSRYFYVLYSWLCSQSFRKYIYFSFSDPVPPKIHSVPQSLYVVTNQSLSVEAGSNVTTMKGNQLSLSCNASGFPPPKLKWFKDGELFKVGARTHNISNLRVTDGGLYTCIAENLAGEARSVTNLTVIGMYCC